jgi:hypothetical protein
MGSIRRQPRACVQEYKSWCGFYVLPRRLEALLCELNPRGMRNWAGQDYGFLGVCRTTPRQAIRAGEVRLGAMIDS